MPRSKPDPEATPSPKKASTSAKKKPVGEPAPSAPAAVPASSADMLTALMAQMQLLVSEVSTLKAQVAQAPAEPQTMQVQPPEVDEGPGPLKFAAEQPVAPASFDPIQISDAPDHAADDWSEEALAAAVAHALANPDDLPDEWHEEDPADYGEHHDDVMPEDDDLAEKYPDLLSEIESFNLGEAELSDDSLEAVTPEEERDLLAGVAEAFELAEADELAQAAEAPVEIPASETSALAEAIHAKPDNTPLTADEIAALVAQASGGESAPLPAAEVSSPLEMVQAMPDHAPLSPDDIAALVAQSQALEAGAPAPASAVQAIEDLPDDAPLSADDIAALVAQSQALEADASAPVSAMQAIEDLPDDAPLSADDIAGLMAQAQTLATPSDEPLTQPVAEPTASPSSPTFSADPNVVEAEIEVESYEEDNFDDLMLDEDALAALVRQSIAAQGEELDAQAAAEAEALAAAESKSDTDSMNDDEIAALLAQAQGSAPAPATSESDDLNDDDIAALFAQAQQLESAAQPTEAESLISADQLSALLEVPDPEDSSEPVPSSSMAMDADELAKLLAEATALGSDLGESPTPTPAAAPAEVNPAASQPVATPQAAASRVAKKVVSSGEQELGAVKSVPAHLAVRALALPMRFAEGKLVCKVAEPVDRAAVDRISKATGFGIVIEPAPIAEVIQGLRQAYAEVQDAHARFAVMTGAVAKPSVMDVVKSIWNKVA